MTVNLNSVLKGYSKQDFIFGKGIEVSEIEIKEVSQDNEISYSKIKNAKNIGLIQMISRNGNSKMESELIRIE